MCDFDDDYGEFEDDGFMDDEMEDTYGEHRDEFEPEDAFDEEPPVIEDEPVRDESECDRFTGRDAFILGGAMGWAYEEGLEERRWIRRKRIKKTDSNDPQDID
jgi:hypothetical protein